MVKVVIFLVAAIFYYGASGSFYLNPMYPVYAVEDSTNSPVELKRLEKQKLKKASNEADIRLKAQDRRENIASKAANQRDNVASRTAVLKARLAQFKDQVKASKVERINQTLGMINQKRYESMINHLKVLVKILDKIETRVNAAATEGKNADSAKSAIAAARTAIQNALIAVEAQKDKDYTIEISAETTVREDSKEMRDSLHTDLKSTQELLKSARTAVSDALTAAKKALSPVATGVTN